MVRAMAAIWATTALWAMEIPAPEEFWAARDFIMEAVEEERVPSVAVAVVSEGKLVWAEGFGWANLEAGIPATADSVYLLASVTKPITATGVMLLADEGKIDLDAPANRYLSGHKLIAHRGSTDEITLRRMLNHTSGLPLHWNFFYNGVQPPPRDETIRRYGFACYPPGTEVRYSNLAFGILDHITASVSGAEWGRFLEDKIFDPIGMVATSDRVRPGLESRATVQYRKDSAGRFWRVQPYGFDHDGASAMWSSANDLARFLRLHLEGGEVDGVRILSEGSVGTMQTVASGGQEGYGVSWYVHLYLGYRSFVHSGGMPGVATVLRGFPEQRSGYVILVNHSSNLIGEMSQRITMALLPNTKLPVTQTTSRNASSTPGENSETVGTWSGIMTHPNGNIPVRLEVGSDGEAGLQLGKQSRVSLSEVRFGEGTVRGVVDGSLETQASYHGRVRIEFELKKIDGRLLGVAVAKVPDYFALSHWVALDRLYSEPQVQE